eukprot:scaffold146744_cov47-Attheya_sp.AAC.1
MGQTKKEHDRIRAKRKKAANDKIIIARQTRLNNEGLNLLAKVVTRVETVDNNASKKDNSEKEKEDSIDEKDEDGDNGDVVSVKEGVNSESDESSVESKDVVAMSAKEKKEAALKKAALKKNPKAVSKKRKA